LKLKSEEKKEIPMVRHESIGYSDPVIDEIEKERFKINVTVEDGHSQSRNLLAADSYNIT